MKTLVAAIALTLTTTGCALVGLGGPASPEGNWSIATEVQGQPITGTFNIVEAKVVVIAERASPDFGQGVH